VKLELCGLVAQEVTGSQYNKCITATLIGDLPSDQLLTNSTKNLDCRLRGEKSLLTADPLRGTRSRGNRIHDVSAPMRGPL
jgi:hypothetical protein